MNTATSDALLSPRTASEEIVSLYAKHLTLDQRERIYFAGYLSEATRDELEKGLASSGRLKWHLMMRRFKNWQNSRKTKNDERKRRNYWPYVLGLIIVRAIWKQSWAAAIVFTGVLVAYLYYTNKKPESDLNENAGKTFEPPKSHELQELRARIGIGGYTKTMFSVQSWDAKMLLECITADPEQIDHPDNKGYFPLLFALNCNFVEGIKLLVDHGATYNFDEVEGKKSVLKFVRSEKALHLLLSGYSTRNSSSANVN